MKCISLLQPWASLLVLGVKKFETRSRRTSHRGELYIHSSKKIPKSGWDLLAELDLQGVIKWGSDDWAFCTQTGVILGSVEIANVFPTGDSTDLHRISPFEDLLGDYGPCRHYYECVNPKVLDVPIPAKGQLGIWSFSQNGDIQL